MRPLLAVAVFVIGSFALSPLPAAAANIVFHTLPEPYALVELPTDLPAAQTVYGDLAGDPDMYEFVVTESITVDLTLYAVDDALTSPPFSGILVRDETERGVREILRMPAQSMDWRAYRDATTKMRYQQSETQNVTLEPGSYRYEVSTPDNEGKYRLDIVGPHAARVGYFTAIGNTRAVQDFHGVSVFWMLNTGVVQFPLLLLIVVVGIIATWRYARRKKLV